MDNPTFTDTLSKYTNLTTSKLTIFVWYTLYTTSLKYSTPINQTGNPSNSFQPSQPKAFPYPLPYISNIYYLCRQL